MNRTIGSKLYLNLLAVVFFCYSCTKDDAVTPSNSPEIESSSFSNRLDSIIQENNLPGGIVGILKNEEISYIESFGYANIENQIEPTIQTIFRIGSISKTFASTLAALCVERDYFNWQDSVLNYIPEIQHFQNYPQFATDLRIGNLTTHTSGLIPRIQDPFGDPVAFSRDSILNRPDLFRFNFTSGTQFEYSNSGVVLLSEIIDRTSGQSYELFVEQELFSPLAMLATDTSRTSLASFPQSKGYKVDVSGTFEEVPDLYLGGQSPAGQYYSNLNDMLNYLRFVRSALKNPGANGILSDQALMQMMFEDRPVPGDYGIGFVVESRNGNRIVGHSGSIHGYTAFLRYTPEADLGIVILVNLGQFQIEPKMGNPLLDGLINGNLEY